MEKTKVIPVTGGNRGIATAIGPLDERGEVPDEVPLDPALCQRPRTGAWFSVFTRCARAFRDSSSRVTILRIDYEKRNVHA